jgi:hypothetical protein
MGGKESGCPDLWGKRLPNQIWWFFQPLAQDRRLRQSFNQ